MVASREMRIVSAVDAHTPTQDAAWLLSPALGALVLGALALLAGSRKLTLPGGWRG